MASFSPVHCRQSILRVAVHARLPYRIFMGFYHHVILRRLLLVMLLFPSFPFLPFGFPWLCLLFVLLAFFLITWIAGNLLVWMFYHHVHPPWRQCCWCCWATGRYELQRWSIRGKRTSSCWKNERWPAKTAVWREVIAQSAYIHFMPYIYNTTVLRKLKNI